MKKQLLYVILIAIFFSATTADAQTWSLKGNKNADLSSKLGTTNAVPLRIVTNDRERIRVDVNGRVGVGTTSPKAKLDVLNSDNPRAVNVINNYKGYENAIGVYAAAESGYFGGTGVESHGSAYGVYSVAKTGGGPFDFTAAGVYGEAIGSGTDIYGLFGYAHDGLHNYGVYGTTEQGGSAFNAAGFFLGDVYGANYFTFSDRKFKSNISPLKNSLKQLMSLKPSAYTFNQSESLKMALPGGKQIGLIADEVKEVFPELVKETIKPASYNKEKKVVSPEIKFESVNYIGLVPVLIESIQEQQKQLSEQEQKIDNQQKQIDKLKQLVLQLTGQKSTTAVINSVLLEQNTPNPLNNYTRISYSVPASCKKAQLVITNASGKIIKEVSLSLSSQGTVNLDATNLLSGTYNYSILVDGKLSDTKKMVVAKNK